jgi:hypothetical protein
VVSDQVLEMAHEKRSVLVMKCLNCGLIDKTMATTSALPKPPPPPPLPPLPKSECKHAWEKEKTVTLDSAYEQMNKGATKLKRDITKPEIFEKWMFRKVHMCVRVCRHCGDIDKSIITNIDSEETEQPEE